MDARIAYVDPRLDAWASWVRGNLAAWPRRTLLARIIEEGTSGAAQGSPVENMPFVVLETDRAVARIEKRLQLVTKVYYLTHSASEVKAAQCHVSRATFWRLVERAQIAVYNQLNCETETPYSQATLHIVSA
jgi:hypothetical protein